MKQFERRDYIQRLFESGQIVDAREIARLFGSSPSAVMNDIHIVKHGKPKYIKMQTTAQNTRAKRMGVKGVLYEKDWQEIIRIHKNLCAICGKKKKLTIDHIKPLSKGGRNVKRNIQPLCKSCNSRKGNR